MARLQEQLQKERYLAAALEAGLNISDGHVPNLVNVDEKVGIFSFDLYLIRSLIIHQIFNMHVCYIDKGRA